MLTALFGFLLLFVGFRRTDDPEFDFVVALVRGISASFSLCNPLFYFQSTPLVLYLSSFSRFNLG
jgi:hypothetical protein